MVNYFLKISQSDDTSRNMVTLVGLLTQPKGAVTLVHFRSKLLRFKEAINIYLYAIK